MLRRCVFPVTLALLIAAVMAGCGRSEPEPVTDADAAQLWLGSLPQERGDLAGDPGTGFVAVVDADYPTLPDEVGPWTSASQLATQALVVALEEVDQGRLGASQVEERQYAILSFWQPQYAELVATMAAEELERDRINAYLLSDAELRARWEARIDAMLAEWDERIEDERLAIIPLLPPDVEARLWEKVRRIGYTRTRVGLLAP